MNGPAAPDTSPASGFSLRRFTIRRLRFIAVAMPLACAVLLLPFDNYLMELLRHFRLWNAVIGLVTGALLLLLRDWRYAVLALLAGVWQGWPVWEYSRGRPGGEMKVAAGPSFTLLTCNLLYECRDPERMIASLRAANPEVLLLLEFTPKWQRKFKESLWKGYPHRVEEPRSGPFGICLASKLPLEDPAVMDVADGLAALPATVIVDGQRSAMLQGFPVVRATVTVTGQRITLIGMHPLPPIRPEMYEVWRDSFTAWPALLRERRADHYVLAGDLNTTPFTRTFTRLCQETGLRDSAAGYGLTNTWHLTGPLGLPLDHVLVSSGLTVLERTIGPDTGSDHRWVMVRLAPSM